MKFTQVPDALYFPIKLILLISFLVPAFLWGVELYGGTQQQAEALAQREIRTALTLAETESHKAEGIAKEEMSKAKGVENALYDQMRDEAQSVKQRAEKEGQALRPQADEKRQPASNMPAATAADSSRSVNLRGAGSEHARAEQIKGIDVSHFQGTVDWAKVKRSGIAFGYAKATGGETYTDPHFRQNWEGMRAAGLFRGAYHFFYAGDDPKKQAANFLKTIGKLREHDLPPMLDLEISDHITADELQKRALVWLQVVEQTTGRRPIVYTDPGFGDRYLNDPAFSRYPLWIAEYSGQVHTVPKPWKEKGWQLWQHSQSGHVNGVKGEVDLDVFKGGIQALESFIADSHVSH